MTDGLLGILPVIRFTDALDILLVAVFLYTQFLVLKLTRGAFVVISVMGLATLYVLAVTIELRLTKQLLQLTFAVALVGSIVMFHEELRSAVERVFAWRIRLPRSHPGRASASAAVIETLIDTVTDLSRSRVGVLIAIPGKDNVSRFVRGGTTLDGQLSESLLKSIFDPHSLGHDGAVLLDGDRVDRFACHLPLSTNSGSIGKRGTRHAAAIGMTEKTDALCLVVSEERGVISIARHGSLTEMSNLAQLNTVLTDFYQEMSPSKPRPSYRTMLRQHAGLRLAALGLALVLWWLVVHGGSIEYRQITVTPHPVGLDEGMTASVTPETVQLIVSGPRRAFFFNRDDQFRVDLQLFERGAGMYNLYLTASDVSLPEGISFVNIAPTRSVRVTIINDERRQP